MPQSRDPQIGVAFLDIELAETHGVTSPSSPRPISTTSCPNHAAALEDSVKPPPIPLPISTQNMTDNEDLEYLEEFEDQTNCSADESDVLYQQIEPKIGMEFDGIEELYEFYRKYAKTCGFPIKKKSARKNVEGLVRSVTIACSRGGKYENTSQNPLKLQASLRIGCNAYITARLNLYARWQISVISLDHNHKMSPTKSCFFRCNRRISAHENALRNKVEKETRADADSFSKQIPTATNFMMERQIQEVYTLSKFKEFQAELIGKIYCEILEGRENEGVMEYVIRESFWLEDGRMIPKLFNVSFRAEKSEVHCSCQLFEFKGILCRHALTVIIHHEVDLLPEKYILRRWRKDVMRAHPKMKIKFNSWENTTEQLRYRELCLKFSEVARLAAKTDHEYEDVKNWLSNKLKQLQVNESSGKQKEFAKITECDEEEKKDEEHDWENILDSVSKSRKVRRRKNRLKDASGPSKKKSDHDSNAQTQVGDETFTQKSLMISNPYMLQPYMARPWVVYPPPQQFTPTQVSVRTSTKESMISNFYMLPPNMAQSWGLYRPPQH